ncbi:hypothetical protein TNCV_946051 [Trichonephila clavipes]|nr:hypothetical protein TNCV_946051 [Trichonephila clavipes]
MYVLNMFDAGCLLSRDSISTKECNPVEAGAVGPYVKAVTSKCFGGPPVDRDRHNAYQAKKQHESCYRLTS